MTAFRIRDTRPLDVLIVEDETLFSMDMEILLEDLGHRVVGVASHVDRALELVARKGARVDCAFLDPVLGLRPSRPVAEALARRGIPLIGIAGDPSARALLPADAPVVTKPCTPEMLRAALFQAVPAIAA